MNLGGIIEDMPSKCTLENNGIESEINVSEIKPGDTLIIKPGRRVAVDCEIISGEGFVENSIITGESSPVFCGAKDRLWAGTMNLDNIFKVSALAGGRDSYINHIENMLNCALMKKAEIQKIADSIASYFVPAVFILAFITFSGWFFIAAKGFEFSMLTAISVVSIACPCALGLALPAAFYFGANTAALNGIIFTGPDALYAMNKVNTIVFDKTGTLTQNKLFVNKVIYAAGKNENKNEIIKIISSIERFSDHPAARALCDYAAARGIVPDYDVENYRTHGGAGISAVCAGKKITAGNAHFIKAGNRADEIVNKKSDTHNAIMVYAAFDGQLTASFEIYETLTNGAAETIETLKQKGIGVYLLTGDTRESALRIAAACAIDETRVYYSMKPDEKAAFIEKLKKENPGVYVVMVGDGINDAPAMASADIAISMSDAVNITRSAADIILSGGGLKNVSAAIELGKKMYKIIKQNFFWAFIYNIVLIPWAMAAKLDPMQAAFAMALSSIFVVFNSTRLKKSVVL